MKKSKVVHIHPDMDGRPWVTVPELLESVADNAFQTSALKHYCSGRPGKGRRKVRVTVTVEEVK